MVEQVWADLPHHYEGTSLDAFVFMPDHMHGIVILGGRGGRSSLGLPDLIHRFKSFTTTQYRLGIALHGWPRTQRLWHRNYYERIIRSDAALRAIRRYIKDNPLRCWLGHGRPVN